MGQLTLEELHQDIVETITSLGVLPFDRIVEIEAAISAHMAWFLVQVDAGAMDRSDEYLKCRAAYSEFMQRLMAEPEEMARPLGDLVVAAYLGRVAPGQSVNVVQATGDKSFRDFWLFDRVAKVHVRSSAKALASMLDISVERAEEFIAHAGVVRLVKP